MASDEVGDVQFRNGVGPKQQTECVVYVLSLLLGQCENTVRQRVGAWLVDSAGSLYPLRGLPSPHESTASMSLSRPVYR